MSARPPRLPARKTRSKRHETEHELRIDREQALGDLRRMTSLHEITAHLTQSGGVREIQDEIVKAAAAIAGADMATLQTSDEDGVLAITAQTGFAALSGLLRARRFATDTACSAAMAAARVTVGR
jgi:hypothetical protein